MRTSYLFLSFVFFCHLLCAQAVKIKYEGDPLPDKDRRKVEQILDYEVGFYSQFGLPDTLTLNLHVFEERSEALDYLAQLDIHPDRNTSGLYLPRLQKAFILGNVRGRDRNIAIIYHELSHHLTLEVTAQHPPIWLMEGLAEYFEHCETSKKGVRHTFTEYEQGRIRTIYMLGDIDLPTFINSNQSKFMKQQRTDEQYAYILSHALVTFWIENIPRQILKDFVSTLQNKNDLSTVSERIERIYPGGFAKFEQDFATFCK